MRHSIVKSSQVQLTIIIPALREEKRIGKTLDQLAVLLRKDKTLSNMNVEVLVVSANSTDRTHRVVLEKKSEFNNLKLLKPGAVVGKGRDVQFGMMRAKGDAVLFMDADLATPLRHIVPFYKTYQKGADVVIATRNLHKHHDKFLRRILSNTGNALFKIASGVWVEDSQCGFKLFSKEASQVCFSRLTIMGWGFDMEVLAIAKANKFAIVKKRINDWKSVPGGVFEVGFLMNAVKSLGELAHIFLRRMSGAYSSNTSLRK
jgi:dolichyl-phosphate beta-glucosyltransferase